MSEEPDAYQTYLLRVWRVQCKGRWQLRASLESPRTGERQWFAGLEQLFAFLRELRNGQASDASGVSGANGGAVAGSDYSEYRSP